MPKSKSGEAHTIKDLKAKIEWLDALSQEGTNKIYAIAKLSLAAMESPGHRYESLAQAFRTIADIAESTQNCINSEAEDVGCNHKDDGPSRRHKALCVARQGGES